MRIVDVTQWYAERSGGIRTYLHAKAAWAAGAGVEHAIVVPGVTDGAARIVDSSVATVRSWSPSRRWGYRLVLRRGPVLRLLEQLAPDVVVMHDSLSFPASIIAWARSRGVATAAFCHSLPEAATGGLPRSVGAPAERLLEYGLRRALAGPDVVFVGAHGLTTAVRELTPAPVVVAPLGVDVDTFTRARPDSALRRLIAPGRSLLLYAGRISPEKRVDLLPPMMAALREPAVMVVAGDGLALPALRRHIAARQLGDRFRLLGHIADRHRLASLMATADCFVHPNPNEPFGLAPLEALAAGCRVVAPRSGGLAESLAGTDVHLVEPDSPTALAAGVMVALRAPARRANLDARSWTRTFAVELEQYELLTDRRPAAALAS